VNDPVLHLAIVEYEHHEHPVLGEPYKLDLGDRGDRRSRHRHDAREARDIREQLGGVGNQGLRIVIRRDIEMTSNLGDGCLVEGPRA